MINQGRFIVGILIILFGLNFLFDLHLFRIIVAGAVIWLGVKVIVGDTGAMDWSQQTESDEDFVKRVLVFSGINKKFKSTNFEGAEVVAVFGGGEVDLSEVKTKQKDLTLDITAVFGGLKIRVPKTWSVKSEGVGVVGGYDNKAKPPTKKSIEVKVKGSAFLGGVEIIN